MNYWGKVPENLDEEDQDFLKELMKYEKSSSVVDRAVALTHAISSSRHMPRSTGTPVVKPLARKTP